MDMGRFLRTRLLPAAVLALVAALSPGLALATSVPAPVTAPLAGVAGATVLLLAGSCNGALRGCGRASCRARADAPPLAHAAPMRYESPRLPASHAEGP